MILPAILADGPAPADTVQPQGAKTGFGVSLLRRSKLALGVRSRRVGRPGEVGKSWIWRCLPNHPAALGCPARQQWRRSTPRTHSTPGPTSSGSSHLRRRGVPTPIQTPRR